MEPQININCKSKSKNCCSTVLCIILSVFIFFLGILVEGVLGIVSLLGLGVIISLLITFGLLFIIGIIICLCHLCKKIACR